MIKESNSFCNTFDEWVTGGGQVTHLPAAGDPTVKCITKINGKSNWTEDEICDFY